MNNKLNKSLNSTTWKNHCIGDLYSMDGKGSWQIAYYPIFECGKTGEVYNEPRALIEQLSNFSGKQGTDFREVPLRYLSKIRGNKQQSI